MISKHKGRYNYLSNEDSWCVSIDLPADAPRQSISQCWDLDEEPDIDSLPPSEVIELISERLERYLLSTKREEYRKVIQWVRDNAERVDAFWAAEEIERLERRRDRLAQDIERLRRYLPVDAKPVEAR